MSVEPAHPVLPTYGEFDRIMESVTGERAPLTARFVRELFGRTRRLRINAKLEAPTNAAMNDAVNSFAETYHANVKLGPQYERASLRQVLAAPKYRCIPLVALEVADEVICERLFEFEKQSGETLGEGLFVVTNEERAIEQARRWLDYVEQTKDSPLFLHFVALGRELTILCRTHDLLDGLILRQETGYAG